MVRYTNFPARTRIAYWRGCELRSDLIDPIIAVHNGRVVKRTGDGAIVEFRSVVDAVRCAIELQDERNAGLPPERRRYSDRHSSRRSVVESDGDLMGDGVNIAARLEASPGVIYLSEDAYRQVKTRLDLAVNDLGETQLKSIAEPVQFAGGRQAHPSTTGQASPSEADQGGPASAPLILIAGGAA